MITLEENSYLTCGSNLKHTLLYLALPRLSRNVEVLGFSLELVTTNIFKMQQIGHRKSHIFLINVQF